MIIIILFTEQALDKLREIVGPELTAQIFFTTKHTEALEKVREQARKPGRTVVVSNRYHVSTNGEPLPTVIRRTDPGAWFFQYATLPNREMNVHGVINKNVDDHREITEFLSLDFSEIGTFKELRRRLPWLE